MHPCLTIFDVLSLIFTKVERDTLTRLAVTCKSFSEPALDLLWKNQDELTPLLNAMAPDLWEEVEEGNCCDDYRRCELDIRRAIVPSDWSRFHFYAHRIQSLSFSEGISSHGFAYLLLSAPTPCLLPNLRKLVMENINDDAFPCVHILLGPKIIEFELRWGIPSNMVPSLLHTLHSKCPDIKTLKVFSPICDTVASCATLTTWDNLQCFHSRGLDAKALMHLSALPSLRELSFEWNPPGDDILSALPFPRQPAFLALRILYIATMVDVSMCNDIIDLFQHSPLKFLCVKLIQCPSYESLPLDLPPPVDSSILWRTFFHQLSTCHPHASLTAVAIRNQCLCTREESIPAQDHIFRSDTLRPLYSFQNMKRFYCTTDFGLDLNDADMEEMACAWPSLQTLHLIGPCRTATSSRVTFAGLSSLIKLCPNLRKLAVEFDARTVNQSPVAADGDITANLAMRKIDIGYSPIEDPAAVAKVLSVILPGVCRIHSSSLCPQWKEVESYLRKLK